LKKRSKKLLVLRALATPAPKPTVSRSFLLLFFKKEALAFRLGGAWMPAFAGMTGWGLVL
jgi:hypothetical protein